VVVVVMVITKIRISQRINNSSKQQLQITTATPQPDIWVYVK